MQNNRNGGEEEKRIEKEDIKGKNKLKRVNLKKNTKRVASDFIQYGYKYIIK